MVMNDDTWYVVRNTRGVTGFVGPGSKPVPLTDTEMLSLGIKNEKVEVDFKEGDRLQSSVAFGQVQQAWLNVLMRTDRQSQLMLTCLVEKLL